MKLRNHVMLVLVLVGCVFQGCQVPRPDPTPTPDPPINALDKEARNVIVVYFTLLAEKHKEHADFLDTAEGKQLTAEQDKERIQAATEKVRIAAFNKLGELMEEVLDTEGYTPEKSAAIHRVFATEFKKAKVE